jgi:ligand-binding sensor domain-containing protein
LWVGTYFGGCRYDGRHWRGFYAHECGLPSDFINGVRGRTATEAWFSTDKGLGVLADFDSDTWVTYTRDPERKSGRAVVMRGEEVLETVETGLNIPHNYVLWVEIDGKDAWVGTSKGLGWAIGSDYYAGLKKRDARKRGKP